MLTGTCKTRVCAADDSLMMARLLAHYYADGEAPGNPWASLISMIVHSSGLIERLPKVGAASGDRSAAGEHK